MQETSLGRRDVLTGVAAGSASAIAGCGNLLGGPQLQEAWFVVEPVTDSDSTDIKFALQYDKDPSGLSASGQLSTAGTVSEENISLGWFDKYSSDNYRSEFPGDELGQYDDVVDQFDEDIDMNPDKTITGRIEDGVSLPSNNYSVQQATVPEIRYTGDNITNGTDFVHLQLHDGLTYTFPRGSRDFGRDGRYDILQDSARASEVGGGSVSFDVNVPGGSTDVIVPSFDHRAQPLVGAIRSLGRRRQLMIDFIARSMPFDGPQSAEEIGRELASRYTILAEDALAKVGPADPRDPVAVAKKTGLHFAPMMAGAVFGPPGVVVGLGATTAYGIYSAVTGLNSFASNKIQSIQDAEPLAEMEQGWGATQVTHLYQETDEHTSLYAARALTGFHVEYGAEALLTGDSFYDEIDKYRQTLDELESQPTALSDGRGFNGETDVLYQTWDGDFVSTIQNGFDVVLTTIERERELLTNLESVVEVDATELLEDWSADTLSATTDPEWEADSGSGIVVQIDDTTDELRFDATGEGMVTVATPTSYSGWENPWVVSGTFTVESLSGLVRHKIRVTSGSGAELELPLVLVDQTTDADTDDGEDTFTFTLDITGSAIDEPTGTEITLGPGQTYEYELSHTGDGNYEATIRPQGGSAFGSVSASGSVLDGGPYGFEYYLSTTSDTVVTHDRLEYGTDT